jgi:Peptidase family M23
MTGREHKHCLWLRLTLFCLLVSVCLNCLHLPVCIYQFASTSHVEMSHHLLSVGVRHRHRIPDLISSSHQSFPISVWDAESIALEASGIEKLKQLCILKPTYFQVPLPLERDRPSIPPLVQRIAFFGVGMTLCLSPHTASDSTLGNRLSLNNLIPSALSVNAAANTPRLAPSVSKLNGTVTAQKHANAAGLHHSAPNLTKPVEGFPITSAFGNRIHPIFGDLRFHQGIDLATPNGTPVKTAGKGVVSFADWDSGYGKTIIIQHESGYETLYAHLDELLVGVGDQVTQGQVIGLSGSTGYVTGPHLHFEIQVNQVAQNPLDYLNN